MVKTERPSNWTSIREHVLRRDNYRCIVCGATKKEEELHVDHFLALSNGGDNSDENLRVLCKICHAFKTKRERERNYKVQIEKTVKKEEPEMVYEPVYEPKPYKPSKLTKFLWWPFV